MGCSNTKTKSISSPKKTIITNSFNTNKSVTRSNNQDPNIYSNNLFVPSATAALPVHKYGNSSSESEEDDSDSDG